MLGRRAQGSRYVLRYVGLFTSLRHSRVDSRARAERNDALCVIVLSSWRAARATWLRAAVVSLPALLSLSLYPVLFLVLYLSLYITREQTRENRIPRCARSLSLSVSRRQCSRTRDRILCNNTPANVNIEL